MSEDKSTGEVTKKFDKNSNLTPGGPGRPKGQKNYSTLYREALIKIATTEGITADELEIELEEVGIKKAMKGDFKFWQDIRDRVHGKAVVRTENKNLNADVHKLQEDEKERLDNLIK